MDHTVVADDEGPFELLHYGEKIQIVYPYGDKVIRVGDSLTIKRPRGTEVRIELTAAPAAAESA